MYDLVAGGKTVRSSYFLSKRDALELFPMLKGDKLTGAIVYYDGISIMLFFINSFKHAVISYYFDVTGQQDDARMNLAVALTASRHGATVVNHVKVVNLLKGLDKVLASILSDYTYVIRAM